MRACASTAYSMGSSSKTSRQNPLTIIDVASSSLVASLNVYYIREVPTLDGWSYPLRYASDLREYTLGSLAKDGAGGGALAISGAGGPTTDFDCDIVFSHGVFVQWPEGSQQD